MRLCGEEINMIRIIIPLILITLFIKKCYSQDYYSQRTSSIAIKPVKIFAETKVKVFSIDSIIIKVSFINYSGSDILLYKKLLPIDPLRLDVFSIISDDSTKHNIKFIAPIDSNIHTYSRDKSRERSFPTIIPDLDSEFYTILQKNDTLTFYINVANYYDFKSELNNGLNQFQIIYCTIFPYVINYKHITEYDKREKKYKKVYFDVFPKMADNDFTIKREKIVL